MGSPFGDPANEEVVLEAFSWFVGTMPHGPYITLSAIFAEITSLHDSVQTARLTEALLPKLIFGGLRVEGTTLFGGREWV